MKHKLPSLMATVSVLWAGAMLARAEAQAVPPHLQSAIQPDSNAARPSAGGVAPSAGRAGEILDRCILLLQTSRSLQARLRLRADVFDERLSGHGTYVQGPPGSRRFRFDQKIQLAGERWASLSQVSDGRYLWTHREVVDEEPELSRIDLDQIHAARVTSGSSPSPTIPAGGLLIGGPLGLLRSLDENFEFDSPRVTTSGGVAVWELTGRWRTDRLAVLFPDQGERIDAGRPPELSLLPAGLPGSIVLAIVRNEMLPLPYRIDYLRPPGGKSWPQGEEQSPRRLLSIEFYDFVLDQAVDHHQFEFDPGLRPFKDRTKTYVEYARKWGPQPK